MPLLKIIDAHIHFSNIDSFKKTANELSHVDYSAKGLLKEFEENNVVLGIAMGVEEKKAGEDFFPCSASATPMGIDLEATIPKQVVYCPGINPYQLSKEHIAQLEQSLQKREVVGIKIYLGYYPFYAYDDVYDPVYRLAKEYELPIVFHTGDTYSERGLLKYSHPLQLDEVAVKHREINFMMAHMGDPWVLDGAEVVYKNRNMYADLSGLVVGTDEEVERHLASGTFHHLQHALTYCDHYEKFIFGTDWPLAPIKPYIKFVKNFIPEQYHQEVFYDTAVKVFPKIKPLVE